jgi:predicted GIY-YIG superfamily endonuclease
MQHVYVLKENRGNWHYIGRTADLRRRLQEHLDGRVAATRHHRPLKLLYAETYSEPSLAEDRERKLKAFGSAYAALMKRLGEK